MELNDRKFLEGVIEEIVGEARFVDAGMSQAHEYEHNFPMSDRRSFLKGAGACLALFSLGLQDCAAVEYEGKTYEGWQGHLMKQDLIFGPDLIIQPKTGRRNDFEGHMIQGTLGGVDYEVPKGTPVVAGTSGVFYHDFVRYGGNMAEIVFEINGVLFATVYAHLSKIHRKDTRVNRKEQGDETKNTMVTVRDIIGYSGNTGSFDDGRTMMPYHLHFGLAEKDSNYQPISPGLDPFKYGITGGKPIYWDCASKVYYRDVNIQKRDLANTLENMDLILKNSDYFDDQTKDELLKRRTNIDELKKYARQRVLGKKQTKEGPKYEFLPGTRLYQLMIELESQTKPIGPVLMLPFPHPTLAHLYAAKNPGIQL